MTPAPTHAGGAGGGRGTLVLAAALLLAGAGFDVPSLYVPGLALLLLGVGLAAWVRLAVRGGSLHTRGAPRSVVEGERYPLELELRRGPLPWPGATLLHPLLAEAAQLPRRGRGETRVTLRFPRRGRREAEPVRLRIADPLGIHAAELEGPRNGAVLVLPRVEPVLVGSGAGSLPAELAGAYDRGPGGGGLDTAATDFEIDGLRPYRPGSAASRIHWPTAARRGELMEHRLVSGGASAPLVVLDGAGGPGEEELDKAVRAAASLCRHLAEIEGCMLILAGCARPLRIDRRLGGWAPAHARLALAGPFAPPPLRALAETAGGVFWVSAAGRRPPRRRDLGGSLFLVTPDPPPGASPAFTVAACSGLRVSARKAEEDQRAAA